MIDSLALTNFKRHTRTHLGFLPFSVLVGPNVSGKTSALEALYALSLLHNHSFNEVFSGSRAIERVVRRMSGIALLSIHVSGRSAAQPRSLSVHVASTPDGEPLLQEKWSGDVKIVAEMDKPSGPLQLDAPLRDQGFDGYWPELHRCAFLRIDPRQVCAPSAALKDAVIAQDGSQLATVLANLKLADDATLARIVEDVRRIVPEIRALRPLPTKFSTPTGERDGYELVFDTDSGDGIRASDMSEGTLVLLTLLTVIHSPARPRLLLLDGLENALHPTAQMTLTKLLRSLVERDSSLQILATTHSPFIIDCVPPEAVLVFAKARDGTTGVRRLTEHPEAERFKGKLSSGQIWTLDDEESWVLGEAT